MASHLIEPHCPCDPGEVNAFDRSVIGNDSRAADVLSDVSVGIAYAAPVLVDVFDVGVGKAFVADMTVYAETVLVSGAVVTFAKYIVQRPLPLVYEHPTSRLAKEPAGYRSFFSGHTTTAFAALTAASMTSTYRHGLTLWPWVITGAFGTSIALERVAAGRHFYTDVIAGALAGVGEGLLIPWLHAKERIFGVAGVRLAPVGDGLQLVMRASI